MNHRKYQNHSLWSSLGYAIQGIVAGVKNERNLRIHLLAVMVVTATGLYLALTSVEWVVLTLTMGMVVSAELMNTAIEAAVDLACPHPHPLAAVAKNAAAAAVLVTAIVAVVIAWLLLWPKLRTLV
ncbi:MAG: diacylglycerol kinase family protein [Bacillota bacterium]